MRKQDVLIKILSHLVVFEIC